MTLFWVEFKAMAEFVLNKDSDSNRSTFKRISSQPKIDKKVTTEKYSVVSLK